MEIIKNNKIYKSFIELLDCELKGQSIDSLSFVNSIFEKRLSLKEKLLYLPLGVVCWGALYYLEDERIIPRNSETIILIVLVIGVLIYSKYFKKNKVYPDILIASGDQVIIINKVTIHNTTEIKFDELIIFSKNEIGKYFDLNSLIDWVPDQDSLAKNAVSTGMKGLVKFYGPFKVVVNLKRHGKIILHSVKYSVLHDKINDKWLSEKAIDLKLFSKNYLT